MLVLCSYSLSSPAKAIVKNASYSQMRLVICLIFCADRLLGQKIVFANSFLYTKTFVIVLLPMGIGPSPAAKIKRKAIAFIQIGIKDQIINPGGK